MQNTCQNCDCKEDKDEKEVAEDACCETGECACDEETDKEDSCCGGCNCGV
ncbi:MAG: hypothetical protein WC070_01415 [Candidatus Magasanikbacteria bacterium]